MLYTSKENPKIKEIRKLQSKKYRDEANLFLIEGMHLVEEAYKSGILKTVIVLEGEEHPFSVDFMEVTKEVMSTLRDLSSVPRIMGVCEKRKPKKEYGNSILILDGIQDPGNLGTIIRSSVAFHVDTIIASSDTVDFYNPKVIRSSQGMFFHQNIETRKLEEVLPILKEKGYHLIGTKVENGISIKKYPKKEKYALIMGNEGNGVRKEILSYCDDFVHIPMNSLCESLNVGVATSIILYEFEKSE